MKKILLAFAALATCYTMQAQTPIMTQNFETSGTSMPTGWSQQASASAPTTTWHFGTNTQLQSQYFILGSSHTNFACVNDDKYNGGSTASHNLDTLYSPTMDLSSYSTVFLSFDYYYYADGPYETATIQVSTDGGATWNTLDTLAGSLGADTWFNNTTYNFSAYAGMSNVKIAFTYDDHTSWQYGLAVDNIDVYSPPSYDVSVDAQNLQYYIQKNSSNTVSGSLTNHGSATISSMDINYSVNGGATQTASLSSLNIAPLTSYNFTHSIPWVPTTDGLYTMKIWATSINGFADQNNANDTLTATFKVIDSIQVKKPLIEEFQQASCDPCAEAEANMDSVLLDTKSIANVVRYHVNWPGRDFMNQVTQAPFIGQRVSYYSVSGVPDAKLDGTTDVYPGAGGINYNQIAQEAAIGSPIKLMVTADYSVGANRYDVHTIVKSYDDIPSGYVLHTVLTVDTITYAQNQSTESIPQYVFNNVAEDMMPNANGSALGAMPAEQSQTVNVSWVKNHPWGKPTAGFTYDSTTTHITVFMQNVATGYILQSATVVPTIWALGIENHKDLAHFNIYPNPVNHFANIDFTLQKSSSVKLKVCDITGRTVILKNEGTMNQGNHNLRLDASKLQDGIYFVNFITNEGTITKKMIVSR